MAPAGEWQMEGEAKDRVAIFGQWERTISQAGLQSCFFPQTCELARRFWLSIPEPPVGGGSISFISGSKNSAHFAAGAVTIVLSFLNLLVVSICANEVGNLRQKHLLICF